VSKHNEELVLSVKQYVPVLAPRHHLVCFKNGVYDFARLKFYPLKEYCDSHSKPVVSDVHDNAEDDEEGDGPAANSTVRVFTELCSVDHSDTDFPEDLVNLASTFANDPHGVAQLVDAAVLDRVRTFREWASSQDTQHFLMLLTALGAAFLPRRYSIPDSEADENLLVMDSYNFAILMAGGPGMGKTTLLRMLAHIFGKALAKKLDQGMMSSKSQFSQGVMLNSDLPRKVFFGDEINRAEGMPAK